MNILHTPTNAAGLPGSRAGSAGLQAGGSLQRGALQGALPAGAFDLEEYPHACSAGADPVAGRGSGEGFQALPGVDQCPAGLCLPHGADAEGWAVWLDQWMEAGSPVLVVDADGRTSGLWMRAVLCGWLGRLLGRGAVPEVVEGTLWVRWMGTRHGVRLAEAPGAAGVFSFLPRRDGRAFHPGINTRWKGGTYASHCARED